MEENEGKRICSVYHNLWFNLRACLLCRNKVIFRIWPYRLFECQLANAINSVFRLYVDGVCYCVWRLVRLWTQIPNSTEIRVETKGTDWCLFTFWSGSIYPYARGAFLLAFLSVLNIVLGRLLGQRLQKLGRILASCCRRKSSPSLRCCSLVPISHQ